MFAMCRGTLHDLRPNIFEPVAMPRAKYDVEHCDKAFTEHSSLSKHRKVHLGREDKIKRNMKDRRDKAAEINDNLVSKIKTSLDGSISVDMVAERFFSKERSVLGSSTSVESDRLTDQFILKNRKIFYNCT